MNPTPQRIREPAVAGLFYPSDPAELAQKIDQWLAAAPARAEGSLRALICPHAGYAYSGLTAARGFQQLAGGDFKTVVVLGPSHYAHFPGAMVSRADAFRTPLGLVPVSPRAAGLAQTAPFGPEQAGPVQRPAWAARRPAPAGAETPDTWEHAIEVEIPFLQRALKSFHLISVVTGEVDPQAMAGPLAEFTDDRSLIVVSSDLSHFHSYQSARELDGRCVEAICRLDIAAMEQQEACGKIPILALLHLARARGWVARKLDYCNSGDTGGDRNSVVGYAAIAFFEPAAAPAGYTAGEKEFLLRLAREAVRDAVVTGTLLELDEASVPPRLAEKKGAFVTLARDGELCGCIGTIPPHTPLHRVVREGARNAATQDSRFVPVAADELDRIHIEISVLTTPVPLSFSSPDDLLKKLRPGHDGVVLQIRAGRATFLPHVWEQLPDPVTFLNRLAEKAGGAPADWRQPGTVISIYHTETFEEPAPNDRPSK